MRTYKGKGVGKKPNATYHVQEFDSIAEVATYAGGNQNVGKSDRWAEDYNLTRSLADACAMAIEGWHDLRARVDGTLQPLREQLGDVLAIETDRVFDVVGVEPDIDRYIAGEMECMLDDILVEVPKQGKVFRMVVDVSMTWANSPQDIAARGAVLCALVESFLLLGYQLELWSEYTARGEKKNEYVSFITRLNKAGELVDIDSLMFCIGHPDFGRRLMWSTGEQHPVASERMGFHDGAMGYYGYQRNGSHHSERLGASSVVSLDGNYNMTRNPMKWITDQLELQGIWEGRNYEEA
jgi:hypothetical protein